MRKIPVLGQNKETLYALVDDASYAYLTSKGTWHERDGYAVTKVTELGRRRQISMHRVVMRETDPFVFIDHKDRNRLNNQFSNLRRVTPKENSNNRSNNVRFLAFGEVKTISEWADDERCNVPYRILQKRIKNGYPPELSILAGEGEV